MDVGKAIKKKKIYTALNLPEVTDLNRAEWKKVHMADPKFVIKIL